MSSNALWKVTSHPTITMGHAALSLPGSLPKCPQDEPIDFSRKSESPPSETSMQDDVVIRKKFKTEHEVIHQNGFAKNGHPLENIGYSLLNQYYIARGKDAFNANGLRNGVFQNGHERLAELVPLAASSPKLENGKTSPKVENGSYYGAIGSPVSCPISDVTSSRTPPRSPEVGGHIVNLSSPSSPETDPRERLRSPVSNGNRMDVCNGVEPQETKSQFPSTMAFEEKVTISSPSMLNGGKYHKLPHLSIPIMNPMNVRKSNGSSPGVSNATTPFNAAYTPPATVYEDSTRAAQTTKPWPVPYVQTSILQAQLEDKKPSKPVRPFKAFGNEILNSCNPELRANPMGMVGPTNFENFIKLRSDYLENMTKTALRVDVDSKKDTAEQIIYDCQSTTTNGCGETSSSPELERKANDSNDSSMSPQIDNDGGLNRRKGNRCPDNEKDNAYWERRRKNNEAAKRSRDARRRKEDALAMTAKELLEDKLRMTMHLSFQMKEIQKLEEENRFLKEREVSLKNYVFHLENRCRDCGLCNNRNPDKRPV